MAKRFVLSPFACWLVCACACVFVYASLSPQTDLKVPAWTIIKMKRKVCWECTNDDTSQCHGCDHYMCIRHGHFEYINNNRYVLCSSCHTTMWAAECRAADADVKARIEQKQKGQEDNMKYEPTEPHVEDEEQRDPGHCNTCRTESDCAECYMCYRKRQIQEETKRAGKKEEVKESKEEKALAPARGRKRKASVASASVPAPTPAVPQGASDVCPVCRQRLDGRVRVCTACKAVVCYTCNEGKGSTTCPVCHSDETHTMSLRKRRTHQGN